MDLGDAVDWSVKLLTQDNLDNTPHANIVAVAKKEAELWELWELWFGDMLPEWLEDRNVMHQERSLDDYVAVYEGCNTVIEISLCDETAHASSNSSAQLAMVVNGCREAKMDLELFSHDTYSFMPSTKGEWLRKGTWDWDYCWVACLYFCRGADAQVDSFSWRYEADEQSGQFY